MAAQRLPLLQTSAWGTVAGQNLKRTPCTRPDFTATEVWSINFSNSAIIKLQGKTNVREWQLFGTERTGTVKGQRKKDKNEDEKVFLHGEIGKLGKKRGRTEINVMLKVGANNQEIREEERKTISAKVSSVMCCQLCVTEQWNLCSSTWNWGQTPQSYVAASCRSPCKKY